MKDKHSQQPNPLAPQLSIGWTSVGKHESAMQMANGLVEQQLAACVQIDGPVQSVYRWQGEIQCDAEYRLMIKFISSNEDKLQRWLSQNHPYDTPQWYVIYADTVAEPYRKWANAS